MRIFADDKVQLEMKKIRLVSAVILMVTFISCGNKSRQAEPIIYDDQPEVELSDPDNTSSSFQNEGENVEKNQSASVCSSSSSQNHNSGSYDNMRGFDPASEDDMEDNGMSRYMENNDEEGWN